MPILNSDQNSVAPRWLYLGARLIFAAVLMGGIALTVVLMRGAGNPPLAGPLCDEQINPDLGTLRLSIPPAPYTLVVRATLAEGSQAWWGVRFPRAGVTITVASDAYFTLHPVVSDSTSFFHIRPAGESNEIYLDVSVSGAVTLRINREIAWQGALSPLGSATEGLLITNATNWRVERIAIYCAPTA